MGGKITARRKSKYIVIYIAFRIFGFQLNSFYQLFTLTIVAFSQNSQTSFRFLHFEWIWCFVQKFKHQCAIQFRTISSESHKQQVTYLGIGWQLLVLDIIHSCESIRFQLKRQRFLFANLSLSLSVSSFLQHCYGRDFFSRVCAPFESGSQLHDSLVTENRHLISSYNREEKKNPNSHVCTTFHWQH